ncbi:hypothetical protein [Fictibacillus gelatini]|uniref:hypothetical protein n=1 Tax=Fictibacillus gelatini TaxID=225985 RepID=UPI00047E9AD5|nr:hypothetical protein [Fictibacillus gelatini]
MRHWLIAVIVLFSLFAAGCNVNGNKQEKEIEQMLEKDKRLTKEEKQMVKDSKLIQYIAHKYRDAVQVTGFKVTPEEPEEAPPYITLKVKDKEKGWTSEISCELDDTRGKGKTVCKPIDNYLNTALTKGAEQEIDPTFKKAFGTETKNVGYLAVLSIDGEKEKNWEFEKTPSFEQLKDEVKLTPILLANEKVSSPDEYYDEMFAFIRDFKKKHSDINLEEGIHFFMESKEDGQSGNPKVYRISVGKEKLGKVHSPEQLKNYTKVDETDRYDMYRERYNDKLRGK